MYHACSMHWNVHACFIHACYMYADINATWMWHVSRLMHVFTRIMHITCMLHAQDSYRDMFTHNTVSCIMYHVVYHVLFTIILYAHLFVFMLSATNSLSNGEVEAIIICCSVFLVGIVIIVIILSIFGFMFKKKRLQSVQTISSAHTSSADIRQQTSMFHCAQIKLTKCYFSYATCYIMQVSGYALCTMDYDRVVIVTVSLWSENCKIYKIMLLFRL